MVYKISEIVKEVGISRQGIYKKLKRDIFKDYIVDLDGVMGITEKGLQLLKKDTEENTLQHIIKAQKTLIEVLSSQLESYDEQLKMKNQQIEEFIQMADNTQLLVNKIKNHS